MVIKAEYEIDPKGEFDRALRKAQKKVKDLTVPLTLISREWFKANRSQFDKGRKGPGKYKDLSEKPFRAFWTNNRGYAALYKGTKDYKEEHLGFVYPILRASGKLADSMTDPKNSDAISLVINKKSLLLGTKVKSKKGVSYPSFLHFGTRRMPARPVVLFGVEQVATSHQGKRQKLWIKTLAHYVEGVTRKAGVAR